MDRYGHGGSWNLGDITVLAGALNGRQISGSDNMNASVMVLGSDILGKQEIAFNFRDYQSRYRNKTLTVAGGSSASIR
ncbi:MAG: hypothetical protein JKY60_12850 [Kordiimonadaceae bacterium]|nr:hypothetical protein [Kordiimonadaceae bacterium]